MLGCVGYFIKDLANNDLECVIMNCLRAGMKKDSELVTAMDKEIYNRCLDVLIYLCPH